VIRYSYLWRREALAGRDDRAIRDLTPFFAYDPFLRLGNKSSDPFLPSSMRLFRQRAWGDWDGVCDAAAARFLNLLSNSSLLAHI